MRTAALLLAALLACGPARAGRPCEPELPRADKVARGMQLAERTARALDASGAELVILARAGQDLSRWGLRWSHLAFAYRVAPPPDAAPVAPDELDAPRLIRTQFREPARPPGTWRVVHKLNHCGSDHAALYRQGLGEFFLDSPHRFEAAYAVPTPALQARLLPLLQDNQAVARWHERRYSLLAYPWATRYQQSNQWLLETLAGGLEPQATTRERAQAWLRFKGFEPSHLRIDAFTRLGARLTRANVAFDDHPNHLRYAGRIDTVGADAVFDWLQRTGLAQAPLTIR